MNILSIQSHVAYGHVGNSSAVFPVQRLGHEVWPVHTVQFSNHTGYGAWKGRVFEAGLIDECVEGIAERGVLPLCDGVLTGYLGSAETGAAILRTVERVKAANPRAAYCCDPVIGDRGRGVFVRPGIAEFFKDSLLTSADILTPNLFELELLAGLPVATLAQARAAIARIHALGPKIVLVTSAETQDCPPGSLDMLASDGASLWRVTTPRLDISVNGAGDAIAALFFAHWLPAHDVPCALGSSAASVYGLLARTAEAGSREILTVAAQEEFVNPTWRFAVERI